MTDDSRYIQAMLRPILLFLFFSLTATCSWGSAAAKPIDSTTLDRALVEEVAVLVDRDGTASIDDVAAADESRFKTLKSTFSAGYTHHVHWLRITLQREGGAPRNWFLEVGPSYLDDVRLFTPSRSGDSVFNERRSGDRLPFSSREVPHRNFVFNLSFPDDTSPYVVYLRIQTTSTSIAQLRLWQHGAFDKATMGGYLIFGALLGMFCLLLIYSGTHWILLKEKIFLLFFCQVFSMLLTYLGSNGIAAQFIFQGAPRITDLMTSVGTCLINFFGYWFFIEFLDVRQRHPRLFYAFLLTMLVSLLALLATFFDYYVEVAPALMMCSLLSLSLCILVSWQAVVDNVLGARWVFAAYAWYGLAVALNLLSLLGITPGDGAFIQGWQHAAPAFIVFLQQAILSRIREAKHRHDQALIKAADAQARSDLLHKQRLAQGNFLSLMAHEIKTPLAVIDAAVQALTYIQPVADPALTTRYERIRGAVDRLNGLLEHSLREVRGEPETLRLTKPHRENFSVVEFVGELEHTARHFDGSQQPTIQYTPTTVEYLYGDRVLIDMALDNLLDNARKYADPESPVTVSITRHTHLGQAGIAFAVASAYVGNSDVDHEAWFQKFHRGQGSETKNGVGLGLYLVRTIAEAHGGTAFSTMSRESSTKELVVTFWIPLRTELEAA